ncbi:UNVERIFIED_CONTAM: hypothetical protein GTU68_009837 [Idotea baltica]|nr:hypothetical protein [Idotea baltica]
MFRRQLLPGRRLARLKVRKPKARCIPPLTAN